jgi:hypothetical protein
MRLLNDARCAAVVLLATVAGALLPAGASAHHADEILFADEGAITLKWADAREGTVISVCNVGSTEARSLRFDFTRFAFVEDGGPREASAILEFEPREPRVLAGGECREMMLRRKAGVNVDRGSYSGFVVATAVGGIARKKVTISYPKSPETKGPRGETLTAADLTDQTLPATNFVSSLFDPYGPTALVLALVVLFLLGVFWKRRETGPNPPDWVKALAVVAIPVLIVLTFVGRTVKNRDDQGGLSAISVKSLPVADVKDGTYGVITDDEADIGKLVVEAGRLKPEELGRAGAYSGKLDLTPGKEKGDATVKVNVRDWWPWAFAIIALGVWTGYLLRRFFETILPRRKLIAQTIRVIESARETSPELPGYSVELCVEGAEARIRELAARDYDKAKEELKTLSDAIDAYHRMAAALLLLTDDLAEVEAAAERAGIPAPDLASVDQIREARWLLGDPPTSCDKAEFEKRFEGAETSRSDIRALLAAHQEAVSARKWAARLKKDADGGRLQQLEKIERDLLDLERGVFLSDLGDKKKEIEAHQVALAELAGTEGVVVDEFVEPQAPRTLAPPTDRAAEAEKEVRDAERRGSLVAGALAVASGLSTLYFADGVWGTPGDYLAALVWGAAVTEALKYVKALADKAGA